MITTFVIFPYCCQPLSSLPIYGFLASERKERPFKSTNPSQAYQAVASQITHSNHLHPPISRISAHHHALKQKPLEERKKVAAKLRRGKRPARISRNKPITSPLTAKRPNSRIASLIGPRTTSDQAPQSPAGASRPAACPILCRPGLFAGFRDPRASKGPRLRLGLVC
jgi:hypothetical protein